MSGNLASLIVPDG